MPTVVNASLWAVGFTQGGVAACSIAAGIQAGIGNVVAGSAFATAQSVAATGGLAILGPVGLASGVLGAAAFMANGILNVSGMRSNGILPENVNQSNRPKMRSPKKNCPKVKCPKIKCPKMNCPKIKCQKTNLWKIK